VSTKEMFFKEKFFKSLTFFNTVHQLSPQLRDYFKYNEIKNLPPVISSAKRLTLNISNQN
ncbi:MAG: hypothetical protein ACFFBD_07820, partial [Candidatus Hodarchaeota archaeon]